MIQTIFNYFDAILANTSLHSKLNSNFAKSKKINLSSLNIYVNPDGTFFDRITRSLEKPTKYFDSSDSNDENLEYQEYFASLSPEAQAAERLKNYYYWYQEYCNGGNEYELDFILWTDSKTDQPVCYLIICLFADGTNEIQMLEILPKYKGSGLGSQLLDFAIKKYGANKLDVHKDNQVAMRLYEKFGFEIIENSGAGTEKFVMIRK